MSGVQGRNLEVGGGECLGGVLFTDLLLLACSLLFCAIQHHHLPRSGATHNGLGPPTQYPTGDSNGNIFSIKSPSSQKCLDLRQVDKNQPAHLAKDIEPLVTLACKSR